MIKYSFQLHIRGQPLCPYHHTPSRAQSFVTFLESNIYERTEIIVNGEWNVCRTVKLNGNANIDLFRNLLEKKVGLIPLLFNFINPEVRDKCGKRKINDLTMNIYYTDINILVQISIPVTVSSLDTNYYNPFTFQL